jgi:small-conductance mechanosensitive channel
MKMNSENRIVILASAVAAGLVGWGILYRPQSRSLFDMLNTDVRRSLQWPIFTIGKVLLTPLFLIKCTVFLILLSLFSRLFRRFLAEKVLTHTSMDRGYQYALVRGSGYIIFLLDSLDFSNVPSTSPLRAVAILAQSHFHEISRAAGPK